MTVTTDLAVQSDPAAQASGTKLAERVRPSIPDPGRIVEASTKSFTVKDFDREVPDDSWDDVDLVAYAKHQAQIIRMLKRTTAIHVYRLGKALSIYRSRHLEHGDWEKYLKDEGFSIPTAWRAVQLAERAKSEDEVADLGITEAYLRFGILKKAADKKAGKPSPAGDEKTPAAAGTEAPAEVAPAVAASRTKPAEPIEDEAAPDSGEAVADDEEPEGKGEEAEELCAEPDGDEPGAKAFQPEDADAESPPSKEPDSPLAWLMQAKRLLEQVEQNLPEIDCDQEDKADYRKHLEEICEIAMRIETALA